ncbi:InlB B-repeat-containing protein [Aliikangiella coralliicola]|uniref:Bacterial repeat domain-containing protein n=1 Tax=Aliikangiella coralliicola TaxID=2592383 RepID=A0A545UHE1_9GAMM|nr:hypothetical protein [Aliikangiella coralliicola]TQV88894.1 hypothetical protein FLL46_04995 [Aliikangiella coralliicola]
MILNARFICGYKFSNCLGVTFLLLVACGGGSGGGGITQYTLTVSVNGSGSVSSDVSGIDCGSDCSKNYNDGTAVDLTAVPAEGFIFSGWSGACSGTSRCQVTMSQNQAVTAVFSEETQLGEYSLNVVNDGGGMVSSQPVGIECGTDCAENYTENTDVTLTATAEATHTFDGWSGDCNGTDTCQLSMSQNRLVTAIFIPKSTLTVSKNEGGMVTSQPEGIDCGNDCDQAYARNTNVVLTATPQDGYIFSGWAGDDCSGQEPCSLFLNGDKVVTATFAVIATELTIADMGMHEIEHGKVFQFQPQINGEFSICRKDMGHDDVKVDSETGAISWDTGELAYGRGFHIRIKCSSYTETAYGSMVVHVDRSGTSRLRVAGEDGISPYIGVAGQAMTGGDTIVFPDGVYPVSITKDDSSENAFRATSPTSGTALQYSTVIARSPGGVTISGTANENLPKQRNAFQFSDVSYAAVVGFAIENVQRSAVTVEDDPPEINRLLLDFIGAAGAGTSGRACSNYDESTAGQCSKAGMRINGGTPVFQNSYDWGHNRYGIMTRSTTGSITRRSFVRLDEHRGAQPFGGFSNYCDRAHLSQDNTIFDSLAIAAPHYTHYAGLEAYPATGCEQRAANLKTEGLLAVNNELSLSLMDQKAGPVHIWDHIVSYDSTGTCTPQRGFCGNLLLQADKETHVSNSFFGQAESFDSDNERDAFDGNDIELKDGVVLKNVEGENDVGTAPEYLPISLLYFRGRSDTFYGDDKYDELTTARRWPIGGEDIIAAKMRSYDNPAAYKVGGGTVHIDGNRGAVAEGESMSEYFWGYTNPNIPPLVVRVKDKGETNRVAWEHLSGSRRDAVTGWKVVCVTSGNTVLKTLDKDKLVYNHSGNCEGYGVKAIYADGESGIAYTEAPE